MNSKSVLYASLAVNAVLLVVSVFVFFNREHESVSPVSIPSVAGTSEQNAQLGDVSLSTVGSVHEAMVSCGVPTRTADQFLSKAVVGIVQDSRAPEYWKPSTARQLQREASRMDATEQARQFLLARFGSSAAANPAFEEFFRPLGKELPFLSSEKQVQIERLKAGALKQRAAAVDAGNQGEQLAIQQRLGASLRALLTSEELFEYELRESPSGQILRASGFDFTEQEYRGVFRIIADQSGNGVAPVSMQFSAINAKQAELRKVLGDARFSEYQRAQDPTFRMLRSIGTKHRITASGIDQAYALLVGLPSIEMLDADKKTELRRVLGEQGFADVANRFGRPPGLVARPGIAAITFPSRNSQER